MQVKDLRNFFGNIFFLPDLQSYTYFLLSLPLSGPSKTPASISFLFKTNRISVWVYEGDASGTPIEKNPLFQKKPAEAKKMCFQFFLVFSDV